MTLDQALECAAIFFLLATGVSFLIVSLRG